MTASNTARALYNGYTAKLDRDADGKLAGNVTNDAAIMVDVTGEPGKWRVVNITFKALVSTRSTRSYKLTPDAAKALDLAAAQLAAQPT